MRAMEYRYKVLKMRSGKNQHSGCHMENKSEKASPKAERLVRTLPLKEMMTLTREVAIINGKSTWIQE